MEMIEIKNLTKKYNDKLAVDNLNLSIKQGKLLALLGVNGVGKTTTLKMFPFLRMKEILLLSDRIEEELT